MSNFRQKDRSAGTDPAEENDFASVVSYATSDSVSEMSLITKLMQELYTTIRINRDMREKLDGLTQEVSANEKNKVEVLKRQANISDTQLHELLDQDQNQDHQAVDNDIENDNVSETETLDGSTINELINTKIGLQVQLQKLDKVDEKSMELLERFKSALNYVTILVENYANNYPKSLNDLESSLVDRLEREQQAIDDCKKAQNTLDAQLAALRESLGKASSALSQATH